MSVALIVGNNDYASTAVFASGLQKALDKLGVTCHMISAEGVVEEVQRLQPTFTASFSDVRCGGVPIGDYFKKMHLNLLIDPVIYFPHQLLSKYALISTVDRGDESFLKGLKFPHSFFLPHAVDPARFQRVEEKQIDILFAGTLEDPEEIRRGWKRLGKKREDLLARCAERLSKEKSSPFLQALVEEGVYEDLPTLHWELDRFLSASERVELLLKFKGLSMHIIGKGPWKKWAPDATVEGPVSYIEAEERMRRAKMVINPQTRFRRGSHERHFTALMAGALPITLSNPFYQEEGFFTFDEITQEQVKELLHNDAKRQEHIFTDAQKVRERHTFDQRAQVVKDALAPLERAFS